MRWIVRHAGWALLLAAVPARAWATEGAVPLGAAFLGGVGALAVGVAGLVCLKLYAVLRGGNLGAAWQTVGFALVLLAVALLVEVIAQLGWLSVPMYVTALIKVLGAAALVLSFLRFAKVFR